KSESTRLGSASFEASAGPHRLLLKFIGSSTPLRVWVQQDRSAVTPARLRAGLSSQELVYDLAAERYASGDDAPAAGQINAVKLAANSFPLQVRRAQSLGLS